METKIFVVDRNECQEDTRKEISDATSVDDSEYDHLDGMYNHQIEMIYLDYTVKFYFNIIITW